MDQSFSYKPIVSSNTSPSHPTYTEHKPYKKCNKCNRRRKYFNEIHQICHSCDKEYIVCKGCNQRSKDFNKIHRVCLSCDAKYKVCKECNERIKLKYFINFNEFHQICLSCNAICKECNRRSKWVNWLDKGYQFCNPCYKTKMIFNSSGNEVIDDFIKYTLTNHDGVVGNLEFVPYDKFKDIEFIAEGGFSKIYRAIWINGSWNFRNCRRDGQMTVVLKELRDSKNINSKELNELKTFYNFAIKMNSVLDNSSVINSKNINLYFGITQHPVTQNFMIITEYCESGDLTHYITNDFYNISWTKKLGMLHDMIRGLNNIHNLNIIHKDYNSGNIFLHHSNVAIIGDLGLSKSSLDGDDNEIYGIIPYVAPEIFQGQKYTKASDIYSFGMIMWELMTGRRPFWDQNHDTDLIIKICDGLRPPIVTNAPEGYIELMKQCWHSDPKKRPTASNINDVFVWGGTIANNEYINPTKIVKSSDVGPITANNPGAIYKSRPLSAMIKSAESTISLKSQSIISETNSHLTKELEFDIDDKTNSSKFDSNNYTTKEIDFDI